MRIFHVTDDVNLEGGREVYIHTFTRAAAEAGWTSDIANVEDVAAGKIPDDTDIAMLHSRRAWALAGRLHETTTCFGWAHDYGIFSPGTMAWFPATNEDCPIRASGRCFVRAYTKKCAPRRPDRLFNAYRDSSRSLSSVPHLDKVITASNYVAQRVASAGIPHEKVVVIPYFLDDGFLRSVGGERAAPPASPRVLYVGRLHESKGVHLFLDALRMVDRKMRVTIVGEGREAYVTELESMAAELRVRGIEIEFRPWQQDRAGLADIYSSADVHVLPSAWPEPFGIVGLEAMAAGLPTVAFDVGGISDWLVDGSTGMLAPKDDVVQLAAKLTLLLDDGDLRLKLGRAAAERVVRYSADRHLAQVEDAFAEARAVRNR